MNTTTSPEPQIDQQNGVPEKVAEHPVQRSGRPNIVLAILGWFFMVIAVIAVVALGLWSYQLNTRLASTGDQLASLQADYDQLKSDHADLATERTRTNATLQDTKAELAKAYADLNSANDKVAAQQAQMDRARNLTAIVGKIAEAMYGAETSFEEIDADVVRAGDAELLSLWHTAVRSPSDQNILDFYRCLLQKIGTSLE